MILSWGEFLLEISSVCDGRKSPVVDSVAWNRIDMFHNNKPFTLRLILDLTFFCIYSFDDICLYSSTFPCVWAVLCLNKDLGRFSTDPGLGSGPIFRRSDLN